MSGPDGQDHRPVANEPPGPVASDPMEISPGLELAHPRAANGPAPAGGTTPPVVGQPAEDEVTPGADLARAAPAPAADHRLDPRPAGHHRGVRRPQLAGPLQGPGPDRRREPGPRPGRLPRLLQRVPPARPALGDPAARDRLPDRHQGLDRDHLPLVAGQLRRAGQARRRLPRLPAQDQQHRLAEPDLRDRLHRALPRRDRDRAAGHGGRATGASGTACRPRSRSCSPSARSSSASSRSACSRCATSDDGSSSRCRCRTPSSSCTTGSRKGSSGPSGCGTCRCWPS